MDDSRSERDRAEHRLRALCDRRYTEEVLEYARPEIIWERGALTLYERRPPWRADLGPEWSRQAIARFRRTPAGWVLYWQRADLRWHRYAGPTKTIAPLIRELEEDPDGCFWG